MLICGAPLYLYTGATGPRFFSGLGSTVLCGVRFCEGRWVRFSALSCKHYTRIMYSTGSFHQGRWVRNLALLKNCPGGRQADN